MGIKTVLAAVAGGVVATVLYLDHRGTQRTTDDLRQQLRRRTEPELAASTAPARARLIPIPVPVATSGAAPAVSERAPRERAARAQPPTPLESFVPVRQGMEALLQGERVDPAWADAARAQAENAFAGKLPEGSRLGTVDCRTTICRIETFHDSEANADQFVERSVGEPSSRPWNGSFATGPVAIDRSSGRVTTLVFLMRESHDLPAIEDQIAPE